MYLALMKSPMGGLVPADEDTAEALQSMKSGDVLHGDFKKQRNTKFHRKFFALLKVGFDHWEPPEITHNGLPVQKNFERFRKDCTIAAGYHDLHVNLRGEVRADAQSISFARMDEKEFEALYSAVVNVLLQRVLRNYTREDLDRVVDRIVSFA